MTRRIPHRVPRPRSERLMDDDSPGRRGARSCRMATATKTAQRISAEGAAALVRPGDWLDYGAVLGSPDAFDAALAERVGELHDVKIRGCLSVRPRAVLAADPAREHFH